MITDEKEAKDFLERELNAVAVKFGIPCSDIIGCCPNSKKKEDKKKKAALKIFIKSACNKVQMIQVAKFLGYSKQRVYYLSRLSKVVSDVKNEIKYAELIDNERLKIILTSKILTLIERGTSFAKICADSSVDAAALSGYLKHEKIYMHIEEQRYVKRKKRIRMLNLEQLLRVAAVCGLEITPNINIKTED